ncbi:MAG: BtrH N-terminal domain-containing protein [Candidatus Firestonebacteria bacterium]|nr:BtrH N-terminal domain-containing protein [Candidatus Firestonebacteria bacterium]
MPISFLHRQSAHCESGVTSNLLTHHGAPLSEAMAFGIGAGLLFGYFPFIKINKLPLATFRSAPGSIFQRVTSRLGIRVERRSFKNPSAAMAALDRMVADGIPVGLQTGVYWLPYFPPALRFHFNAHNLVVYGAEGDAYCISDPVFPDPVVCPRADLARARFARGALAPQGKMYCITAMPKSLDLAPAIKKGIQQVSSMMVKVPFPLIGTRGIRTLAKAVEKWPRRLGERLAILHLGHIIRMQEEIGTGGGGFRFIYAAFLQEASEVLGDARYLDLSRRMTAIGDQWREFALAGARHCKGRAGAQESFSDLANILRACADSETALFNDLHALVNR